MKNVITKNIPELLTSAQDAAGGAAQFGPAIGLVHNTEVNIRADITALLTRRDAHTAGQVVLKERKQLVQNLRNGGKDFLRLTRELLKETLGKQHSEAWIATGFRDSLELVSSAGELQARLQSMQAYLAANPNLENASLNVTAVRAQALFDDLSAARVAVNVQETAVANLLATRNEGVKTLQGRLRGLINELGQLIGSLDERWTSFGFNRPGAQERPETPENVSVILIGNHAAAVKFAAGARANYYRVYKKVVGVDKELVAVGSPADLDFTLEGLPVNAQVQIAVSAVNTGGESALSEVVTVTTH